MNNTDLFLDKYKKLEVAVKSKYGLYGGESFTARLRRIKCLEKYSAEIKYCADVRNLLSHNPKIGNAYAVEPSQQMLDFMDFIIEKVKSRPRCRDIAIKYNNILKASPDGKIIDFIKIMYERGISHLPIVQNHRVIGVYNAQSVYSYLSDFSCKSITALKGATFRSIEKHLSVTGRKNDEFIFVRSNMYVDELEEIFEKSIKSGKRIRLAFLTQNGKPSEPLQGIITPWDIIGAE